MEIKVLKNDKGIFIMKLSGVLDLYSSNQVKNTFIKILEKKIESLVISLKEVKSMDSAGIGALIYISSTLKKLSCPLVIVSPDGPALQAIEVSRLSGYFKIVPDLKKAVFQSA